MSIATIILKMGLALVVIIGKWNQEKHLGFNVYVLTQTIYFGNQEMVKKDNRMNLGEEEYIHDY